ncbi:hypothetical protein ACHAXR_012471 [Thalassiosira sp. AJA248-18]
MKFRMTPSKQRGGGGGGGFTSTRVSLTCLSSLFIIATTIPTTTAALTQQEVLNHIHGNLNGPNWENTVWNTTDTDPCSPTSYPGVTCNSDGEITEIDLSDNDMAGSISPHVYTLPYLKNLDFSKNRITNAGWDRIDSVLTDDALIANIESIDLTNNLINTLEGVSQLSDTLTGLHLTYNNLKGSMPDELFGMYRLEILAVSENELSGEIDTRLGKLTNLLEFYCYGNQMTGEIPTEIGLLTKMQIMTFAENKLKGRLPEEIKNMGNLQTFSVHNNDPDTGAHTGPLPTFDTNPYLNEVYLDGNAFSGQIPGNFLQAFNGTTDETVTIGLSNNQLTGTIPEEFMQFDSLVLNVLGNDIDDFGDGMCDKDGANIGAWMNGLVEMFGCDAILCPVGTYSDTGRQEEEDTPCEPCGEGTGGKLGATTCVSEDGSDGSIPLSQLQILAEFYLALGGPQWDEADGWDAFVEMESAVDLTLPTYQDQNIEVCDFKGVVCTDKEVIEISLPNNGLEGLVPSSFWGLMSLKELDLSGNELRFDRDFGFGGIGNAPALRKVDLSSNDIQVFKGIGRATALEELYVDDAYFFEESLDAELYQLDGLKILHMQFSGLKGKIPDGLSGLKNLRALNLYGNELTGKIPDEIGLMTKLWHVDFSENDLTGHLPTDAIAKLLALEKFHVHQSGRGGKGITGKLPSFKEQKNLHMLDVNSNVMTGSIPEDFLSGVEDADRLMEIDIGYNEFTGTVPSSLSRFTNMRFDAVKNKITGIDPALCSVTDSIKGWFNGQVGKVIEAGDDGCNAILCPKGTYNDYGRAKSGTNGECLECANGKYAGQTSCDIDGDGLPDDFVANGEKKVLDKVWYATGGSNWTKGANWTEGAVCDYEGVTCESVGDNVNEGVVELNLAGFGLMANIPTQIFELPYLKKVDFSNNIVDLKFDGIAEANALEVILMEDTDLASVDGIGDAPSLKKLHIGRNSFPEGTIPDELYSITTLESLGIGYNNFEGSISPDIGNLNDLEEFWAGLNDLTGSIPKEMADLSKLRSLVLSGNRMSGEIPNDLEKIETLKQLHLNGQRDFGGFTGKIPSFSESLHLWDIDFSRNSLTGSIPGDFLHTVRKSTDHDDYAYDKIDLSSNQITGTIPENWDDFVGIFANLANNKITGVPDKLCDDDDEFMDNLVGELSEHKCDAILCRPGFFSAVGRQTKVDVPCQQCPEGSHSPYFGMLKCISVSEERKTLEQIHGLIFTGASEDTYWMTENPICSWYGIKCDDDSADSGVTEIKLESNSLTTDDPDKVSKLFFDLPLLESLNIRGNKGLSLTFDNVGKPPNLGILQLSATGLTSIDGIGKATKLKELHVTENDIDGAFPEDIFDLTFMELLYISFNKISSTLPTRIGELTGLREFYAYTNELTGSIPTELGKLVQMENLVLGENSFEGSLPTELNELANLKEFSVYYSGELTGPILDFSKVTQIEKLDLEGNQFTGRIPSTFLSGLDQDYISEPDNEIILHLADNILTGAIPEGLQNIKKLYLDIAGNQFKELPKSFCQQSYWMNGKVGELNSCAAIACPQNTFSETGRMHSDGDEKCTPCASQESAPFVGSYSCSHETREINALKKLYLSTSGDMWDENMHWMNYSVPICNWHGVTCAGDFMDNNTITELNLPDNSLDGTMPQEIFGLPALKKLNVKENNIFMKFENIGSAKSLELLYISDIDIGSIDGIGKAPALKELHLTANELTGELPADFFDFADTMERLYIAYNSFTGTLSTEFGKMTNLVDFYAYDNNFAGSIPSEFASLQNLENLVLAENKLSGTISEKFSSLPKLTLFSAYRRLKPGPKLSGPLPSFSNAPKLEGLYLDYNHLTGTIPSNFLEASLNTNLVTISHNLLSGKVPIELAVFDDLNIEMEGNKITQVDERLCDNLSWMNGLMKNFSCDAFMCEPGYFSMYGRQNTTESSCKKCAEDTDPTPYWGSTSCDSVVDEKEILELLYSKTGGDDWHNNANWMKSDNICTWYGVECRDGSVQTIRLGANNLEGTPPEEIFRLHQLHTLWLHSNPIDFKFKGIGKAQNLVELRLDSTGLSDVFGLGEASSLMRLDLKYNQISGSFPAELLNLEKLESLSLTDNSLTGALPDSFGKLDNLIHLRLGSNMFSGELNDFRDLKYLLHLDLSDNDLVGTIPRKFLSSISARKPVEVDLSSNNLSGGVPLELDRLDQLVIYLRDNKFTELDKSLCDSDNQGWNLREVQIYGCAAIMCPPGTANYHGRRSGENVPCLKCESNTNLYGQITCNGLPLAVSSSSRIVQGVVATLLSSFICGVLLMQ